jgi:hypothetical protein
MRDRAVSPALARIADASAIAVMPTRTAGNGSLADACRTIAYGSRTPSPTALSLGDTLGSAGVRAVLLGASGDTAPLAPPWAEAIAEDAWRREDRDAADGVRTEPVAFAGAIRAAVHSDRVAPPSFIVAVFDDLYRTDRYAPLALPRATTAQRRSALQRLDEIVTRLTGPAGLPTDAPLLLVALVASDEAATRGERLGPVLLWSAASPAAGLLTSPSTRNTPGLVPNTDIGATVATLLNVDERQRHIGAGRPAATIAGNGDDLERRVAAWAAQVREQRLLVAVPWFLALALLAAEVLGRTGRTRPGSVVAAATAAVPLGLLAAAPLAPVAPPLTGLVYAIAAALPLGAGIVAALTRPLLTVRAICLITTLTVIGDTLLGGPLLSRSPLSYSVVEAARFYGIGNEVSGVLLGSALMAVPLFGLAWGAALLWGAAVALTSAAPSLGADAGGFVADLAAFLSLMVFGARNRKTKFALAVLLPLLCLLLVAGYVWYDAGRGGAARTHVGETVALVQAHGPAAIAEIVRRKALVNVRLAITSPWAALLGVEAVLCTILWRRERLRSGWEERASFFAAAVGALVILLANDSGIVAAATCLLYPVAVLLATAPPTDATVLPPRVPDTIEEAEGGRNDA